MNIMKSEKQKLKFKMSGSQTANSTLFSENGIFFPKVTLDLQYYWNSNLK